MRNIGAAHRRFCLAPSPLRERGSAVFQTSRVGSQTCASQPKVNSRRANGDLGLRRSQERLPGEEDRRRRYPGPDGLICPHVQPHICFHSSERLPASTRNTNGLSAPMQIKGAYHLRTERHFGKEGPTGSQAGSNRKSGGKKRKTVGNKQEFRRDQTGSAVLL